MVSTIETIDPKPFKHLIMTIGELPSSFVDSMSYYEMLAWLCDYLEKQVVPVVNNNSAVVAELKEYVETYFDNLDVQEEINNKLDDMAESGELTDLIAAYLNLRGILAYDNIAAMKLADNLVDGSFAETYGFYAKGDEGGAKYKVREITNADTVDEVTLIALADPSLVAELMLEDTMNVKQFGAKGDGTTDDTAKIQKALNTVKSVFVPDGTYMVNAITSISPVSNQKITLSSNAIIKAIANDQTTYAVVMLDDVDNVVITGGTIMGDKSTHTGATGEHGHCIHIEGGSDNILIDSVILKDAWGDGVYVSDSSNVKIENCYIDGNRRQGISITYCDGFQISNNTIKNTSGTAPQSGIDLEPNSESLVKNGVICNNTIINNAGDGIDVVDNYYASSKHIENITISDNIISEAVRIIFLSGVEGIIISNNHLFNSTSHIIALTRCNHCVIDSNTFKESGSANIYLEYSNSNIITNNEILGQKTTSTNHSVSLSRSSGNLVKNNLITGSRRSGINLSGQNSADSPTQNVENIIDGNRVYNNSLNTPNSDNNIVISNYAKRNVISNNNMLGGTGCKYNIYFNDALSQSENMVIGNVMTAQTTGSIYLRNNKSLNNITDLVLDAGNLGN